MFLMVTTSQGFRTEVCNIKQEGPEGKPTKANQNKEYKHRDKEAMETPRYQKAKDKMVIRRHHISIFTLNKNGLNSLIKSTELQNGSKTKANHMLPPVDTSQFQRQIQTQSERAENDISNKWHSEKSRSSSTNIKQNRLQNKKGKERY